MFQIQAHTKNCAILNIIAENTEIIAALMIESSERQSVRQNTHDE